MYEKKNKHIPNIFKNLLNQKEQLHFRQGPHNQELMLFPKLTHVKKLHKDIHVVIHRNSHLIKEQTKSISWS
jgi:hypothetical protein